MNAVRRRVRGVLRITGLPCVVVILNTKEVSRGAPTLDILSPCGRGVVLP